MRRFVERLLNLLRVRRPDADLAREIDAHLRLLQDSYEARGLSADAARRAARMALGGVEVVKERHRDARSFGWIEDAHRDAAHGVRLLGRSPVFTLTAVLSLAVGIGANTAIFTVANALLFRPPVGVADPVALVSIGSARGDKGLNPLGYESWLEIVQRTTTMSQVFAVDLFPHVMGMVPAGTEVAESVVGRAVSANFFATLGAAAARGRVFREGDEGVAVLDYDYWKRRFNGDDRVVGQILRLNGRAVTIVGVTAPGFEGTGLRRSDLWLAFEASRRSGPVVAGGRVRPGVSTAVVAAEVRSIGDALNRQRDRDHQSAPLDALAFSRAGGDRNIVVGFTIVLMTLVSLVLMAACANVAGILLTRATARGREMALRAALGAGRTRLIRQLLTETAVLFLFGGALGVAMARGLLWLAAFLLPSQATRLDLPLALDWRVLVFALSMSIVAAVMFGVWPAFRGARADAGAALREGARSTPGGTRLRSAFVVGQIACAVLLVALSASFVRILRYAGAADPGFDARGVEVATIDLAVLGERVDQAAFWQTLLERMRQTPAILSASLARVPPGGWEGIGLGGLEPADRPRSSDVFVPGWNIVDVGYFSTLRIPLVEGRDFAAGDAAGTAPVVILSQAAARRLWPRQSAIGQSVRLPPVGDGAARTQRLATVVGVAGDIRSSSLVDGLAEPFVYLPLAQSGEMGMTGQMSIVARRRGQAALGPLMATVAQQVDPRLVFARTESLTDAVSLGLTPQRVLASISGSMGLVALLLTSMGIYGVTAYSVALRRREFAIRLALGAPRTRVVRMVIGQSLGLVAAGLVVGLTLALGAGQVLSVFFYGLPAVHGPTLVGTMLLFAVIAAVASLTPAGQAIGDGWRRALQED